MRRAMRRRQCHGGAALPASADERRRAVVRHGRFQLDVGKGVLTMGRGHLKTWPLQHRGCSQTSSHSHRDPGRRRARPRCMASA